MRRLAALLTGVAAIAALAAMTAAPAVARPRGTNGKIVTNSDNLVTGEEQVYTVDPGGTDQQLAYNNSEVGQWSPDGTRIALVTQLGLPQVLLFNVDSGSSVYFGLPFDLYPDLALFCTVWSPDGARLACEGQGQTDPSLNGVYTLRSSDGGDLQRVTYEPNGDDCPSDNSPNGKYLVVTRAHVVRAVGGQGRRNRHAADRLGDGLQLLQRELVTAAERDRLLCSRSERPGLSQLDLGRPLQRHRPAAASHCGPMRRPVLRPDDLRVLQPRLVSGRPEDRLRTQPG